MTKEGFVKIFKNEIYPFINEMGDNNSLIEINNPDRCIDEIFRNYHKLNKQYKEHIFPSEDSCLLDRHRVASCICGAVLRSSVFDTAKLMNRVKNDGIKVETVFYYANEIVALYSSCKFLSFFLTDDSDDDDLIKEILETFPIMPSVLKIKKGFWNCILFNLYQIKDKTQIGLEHYDLYAYAMIFFGIEKAFTQKHLT